MPMFTVLEKYSQQKKKLLNTEQLLLKSKLDLTVETGVEVILGLGSLIVFFKTGGDIVMSAGLSVITSAAVALSSALTAAEIIVSGSSLG